jgi:poly(A) polymerase
MLEKLIGDQYQNFLIVVRCVRKWAKAKGLYGNKLGYLGGVNFNILVAHICQLYPKASAFFLLTRFFSRFGEWKWPEPVQLNDIQSDPPDAYEKREVWSPKPYHHFPIITPAYPATNSSDKVSKHTREVMVDEMLKASNVTKNILKGICDWDTLFENSDFYLRYSHYLKCNIIGAGDDSDSRFWMGFCESRLVALPRYLENSCTKNIIHLYPVAHKTSGANSFCYFIGFDFDDRYKKEDKADVERIISQSCHDFESQVLYHPEKGFKGNKIDGCDFEISLIPWARLPSNLMDAYGGKAEAKSKRQELKAAKAAAEEAKKKENAIITTENNNNTDATLQNQTTNNAISSVEDIVKVKRKRAEDEANHPSTSSKNKQVSMILYDIIAPKIIPTSNKIKPGFTMMNVKW